MTDEKRKVNVYEYCREEKNSPRVKKWIGPGVFHQFGNDFEEFENGPGNFATAIVEMPDGSVKNISLDLIIFLD